MKQFLSFIIIFFIGCTMTAACSALKSKGDTSLTPTISIEPSLQPFPTIAAPPATTPPLSPIIGDTLHVATSADFPPWEYVDAEKNLKGFDIELMQEIAKRGGVSLDLQDTKDYNSLLSAIEKGEYQAAIASITPSEKRRKQVDFSNIYYPEYQSIVTAPDLPISIANPKDIVIYNIGVITNTALDRWVIEELARPGLLPLNNLNRYDTAEAMVQALTNNTILVGLMDSSTVLAYESDNKVRVILTEQIVEDGPAIALRKGDNELKQALNDIIHQLIKEGFIDVIAEKYFRQQLNP